jgi:chorismate mutase/prephenate dehydratase
MSVEEQRAEIDSVDDEIVALLNRRARLSFALAVVKSAAGLPLHDPGREREVMERACRACSPPLDEDAVRRIFTCILQESRRVAGPLFGGEAMELKGDAPRQNELTV